MTQRKLVSRRPRIFQTGERFQILRKRTKKEWIKLQKHRNKVQSQKKEGKNLLF